MIVQVLHINQIYTTEKPTQYVCFGLGSCIGLFVVDRLKGISGGAHIPLPTENLGGFMGASDMIEQLMKQLSDFGSNLEGLRAKLTGGSQVYEGSFDVGAKNTEAVLKQLLERKIFIASKDVGGCVSRTARFSSITSELIISTSEQKKYTI
jgi:chemotaxis protein CheD